MKKIIMFLAIGMILTLGLSACSLTQDQEIQVAENDQSEKSDEPLIGGQRDEHGCLGPAGYSWNEDASSCMREWEVEGEGSRRAIKIAVEDIGWTGDSTVIEVVQARCIGCFVVKLEKNSTKDRKTINIDNWEAKEVSLTPEECKELGGEPLNIVGGATCATGEKNIGEVTGFISPNICCVSKN